MVTQHFKVLLNRTGYRTCYFTMIIDALEPTHLPPSLRYVFARCRTFRSRALRLRTVVGGIAAVMILFTTVQTFVAFVSTPSTSRTFEHRVEVGVLSRRFRRVHLTSFWMYVFVCGHDCVTSSLFVRKNRAHSRLKLGIPNRYAYKVWMCAASLWVFPPCLVE